MWYPNELEYLKSKNALIFNPGLQLFYRNGLSLKENQTKVLQLITLSYLSLFLCHNELMQNDQPHILSKPINRNVKKVPSASSSTMSKISTTSENHRSQKKSIAEALIEHWKRYCHKTHVHGMKYLTDQKLHPFERVLIAIILVVYVFGTVYVSILFSYKFKESALNIVVESTTYPAYYIVFPALTICNYNRLNWSKISQAQNKFLPKNSTQQTIDLFQQFFARFETFSFGKFSVFNKYENITLKELDRINITEVIEFLSYRCDELFQACWWKDQFVSCCELFVLQKSESGFCLSFNSMTSGSGIMKQKKDIFYPWHVAKAGFNSALKVYVVLDKNKKSPFNKDENNGVAIIIHSSYQWPLNEQFIPENSNVSISIDAKLSYAGVETYGIQPEIRDCIFDHEQKYQFKYTTLPGMKYSRSNCIAQCHQQFAYGVCNCSLELFYPIDRRQATCKASDFKCLYKYHSILVQDREPDEELYINYTGDGMKCRCLSECYSVDFDPKILPISATNNPKSNLGYVSLDIFYEKSTIIKYRIDLAFGIMDLLVAYGGIAGLFIGCSLFSGVEIIYYMTIRLFIHLQESGCFDDCSSNNIEDESLLIKNEKKKEVESSKNVAVIKIKVKPQNPAGITEITELS